MAKVVFNDVNLQRILTEYLVKRANAGLIDYRAQPLKYDDPGYPFDRREEEDSIRDPGSSTITPIPLGIRVTITAPGAVYIEEGNEPRSGGDIVSPTGDKLYIPQKGKLTVSGGRVYFVTESVKPYAGTGRLRRAMRKAFGIPYKE